MEFETPCLRQNLTERKPLFFYFVYSSYTGGRAIYNCHFYFFIFSLFTSLRWVRKAHCTPFPWHALCYSTLTWLSEGRKCRSAICRRKYRRSDKYWEFILMNKNTYTHTHTHFKSKVLGSRLSRTGSPLAALSQLRSTERVGWEGWVTEVEGGERDGEIFQGTSVTVSNLWAAFFAARSVTHGFSCMTDQELWEF